MITNQKKKKILINVCQTLPTVKIIQNSLKPQKLKLSSSLQGIHCFNPKDIASIYVNIQLFNK